MFYGVCFRKRNTENDQSTVISPPVTSSKQKLIFWVNIIEFFSFCKKSIAHQRNLLNFQIVNDNRIVQSFEQPRNCYRLSYSSE